MSSFDPGSPDPRWRSAKPAPGPIIDMTTQGDFVESVPPIPARILGVTALIAIVGAAGVIALLALWLALSLIPIVLVAGVIAYGAYRVQLWSSRRASLGGKRDLFRP